MSQSSTPKSYSDGTKQTMPPVQQASNSSIDKEHFSEVSNLETNPYTRGHPSQSTSPFGYDQQTFQTDQPSFQNDHFSFQNGQLPFQNDQLSFQNGLPSLQNENPPFQSGQLPFQNDQPSFQKYKPSFQNDQPSFYGDSAAKEINDGGKKDEDSDPWKIGAHSNADETPDEKENSLNEMELALSESLGTWATEFRDEVMMLKPSFQHLESQDESIVTRAEILLRDTVQYREKLAAIKDQYSARLEQVSSSLFIRSHK